VNCPITPDFPFRFPDFYSNWRRLAELILSSAFSPSGATSPLTSDGQEGQSPYTTPLIHYFLGSFKHRLPFNAWRLVVPLPLSDPLPPLEPGFIFCSIRARFFLRRIFLFRSPLALFTVQPPPPEIFSSAIVRVFRPMHAPFWIFPASHTTSSCASFFQSRGSSDLSFFRPPVKTFGPLASGVEFLLDE